MKKYRNWIKFKDLQKKDKIFRIINLTLMLAMLIATIGLLIYYLKTGDKNNRMFACVAMSVVYLIPFILELIIGRRIQNLVTFYFLIYALVAGLIGSGLNLYKSHPWFDIPVHILAGYTFSFFGIFILSRLEKYHTFKPITIIIFCFFCTLSVELVWELVEWFSDLVLHQTAQGEIVPGYGAPLVTDTNLDMLCNFVGGIIFAIQFIIGKYTKVSLGVKFFEEELCPKDNKKENKIVEDKIEEKQNLNNEKETK